jgi:RNA polymerase-interacting CarD/CdnL/TRCF family regulator
MANTTIQLSEQTKAELDKLKKGDIESYDATVRRLIRNHDGDSGGLDEQRVREIVREEIADATAANNQDPAVDDP